MKSTSAAPLQRFRREPVRCNWQACRTGLLAFALLPLAATAQTITTAVPGLIAYQGKVSNAAGTLVGAGTAVNRTVTFRIWGHSSDSTINDLLYSEQQTVTISEGEFSVLIGSGSALSTSPLGYSESAKGPPTTTVASAAVFGGTTRYLGVTVDDGTGAADPEVSPRQQLVTSAYAFRAKYAESLGSNGNNTLYVTDTGNVGIGNATPGFPLNFSNALGDKISLWGSSGPHYGFGVQGSNLQIHGAGATDDVTFGYGTSAAMTETMRIKGNGNVGIGTNAPTSKLDVNGVITLFDGGLRNHPAGLATEVGAGIVNFGINDSRFGTQTATVQGGFLRMDARAGTNLYSFFSRPANGSLTEIVSITPGGNVGIGTTSPTNKLHVNGGITATSLTISALALSGPLQASGAVTTHTQGAYLEWNKDSTGATSLLNQKGTGAGGILFGEVDTANVVTERMRLDSAGNLGIGTTAPKVKLDVNGVVGVMDGANKFRSAGLASEAGATIAVFGVNDSRFGAPAVVTTDQGGFLRVDSRANSPLFGFYATPASGSLAQVFSITNAGAASFTGNLGIGAASSSTYRLQIGPSGNVNAGPGGLLINTGWVNSADYTEFRPLDVQVRGASQLVVNTQGYVGLGTTTPTAKLDLAGGFHMDSTGAFSIDYPFVAGGRLYVGTNGRVGIGTATPAAPLQVANNVSTTFTVEAWGNSGGWANLSESTTKNLGAIIDSGIRAAEFYVSSDARIKQVQGRSSGVKDLATLQKIEVTDYTYRDKNTYGGRAQKKAIAQQVEQVFPLAVGRAPGVVSDIFQKASTADGWVALETDLKVGERVRLIAEGRQEVHEVIEVQPGRFRTAFKPAGDKVFVYGREVNDFRSVDYEAIAMLNVSATQELTRQNEALIKRVAELEAKDRARDAKLAAIEKLLQSSQTVMASPAKPATANGQE